MTLPLTSSIVSLTTPAPASNALTVGLNKLLKRNPVGFAVGVGSGCADTGLIGVGLAVSKGFVGSGVGAILNGLTGLGCGISGAGFANKLLNIPPLFGCGVFGVPGKTGCSG